MNARALAAKILCQVIETKTSLRQIFTTHLKQHAQASFIKALCFGVCREYFSLLEILDQLLEKPLAKKKKVIHYLLLVGLFELRDAKTQDYAIVSETVNACHDLKMPWAKGLCNALLRKFIQERATLQQNLSYNAQIEHPQWFVQRLQQDWPLQWEAIIAGNQQEPPYTLRINLQRCSREEYLKRCRQAEIAVRAVEAVPSAVVLESAREVLDIPGFNEGDVSVQDASAQCLMSLLDLNTKLRVLDACTAPGGKLMQIAENFPQLDITAVEIDQKRMEKVKQNLERASLENIQLKVADATNLSRWHDGKAYDRIIIDAPCSASGIVRRQVDVKCHRQWRDVAALLKVQQQLLESLWPLLVVGGRLVYVTCSVFKAENHDQIKTFLQSHKDAESLSCNLPAGQVDEYGCQIFPGGDFDGFFFAVLTKNK